VLALVRQDVVGYGQQVFDADDNAVFLINFPRQRIPQRFAKFNRAAGELPQAAFVFGLRPAFRQEDAPLVIADDRAHPHTDVVYPSTHVHSSKKFRVLSSELKTRPGSRTVCYGFCCPSSRSMMRS